MTSASCIGKGLAVLALAALGACGTSEGDATRFRGLAERVASIDVPLEKGHRQTAREAGLRGAAAPLRVEVMTPYQLWDARDGALPPPPRDSEFAPALARTVAPAVASAALQAVKTSAQDGLRRPVPAPAARTIQLGAYSSADAARAAWARLSREPSLSELTPSFEQAEIGGRTLTRLKVKAAKDQAAEICRAAGVVDPWCARSAA